MKDLKTVRLFGFDFVSEMDIEKVADAIIKYDPATTAGVDILPFVVTPNVDQIVQFERDKELKDVMSKAYLVTPDGQPIIWSGTLMKRPIARRITGADLFTHVWKRFITGKRSVLCIVPTSDVAALLAKEYPEAHMFVPPMITLNTPDYHNVVETIIRIISEHNIKFIIIGISYPKREYLARSIYSELGEASPLMLLFGAAFEFHLGIKKRAPEFVQRYGLEWFYRFLKEPRRLFKRYFVDGLSFIKIFITEVRSLYRNSSNH